MVNILPGFFRNPLLFLVPFLSNCPEMVNTHIQFISNQQDQGVKINQQHQDKDGANGTIDLVVGCEIPDPIGKQQGGQYEQEGGKEGPGRRKPPSLWKGRSILVDESDGEIKEGDDHDPPKDLKKLFA